MAKAKRAFLDTKKLAVAKLVHPQNLASDEMAYDAVSRSAEQGSQDWGATTSDAVINRMALELHIVLLEITRVEELEKQVKALQLENGRLRAKMARDEA